MSNQTKPSRLQKMQMEIDEAVARAEAIAAVASEEDRELSSEEVSEIDAICGTKDKPGIVAGLKAKLEREQRIAALASAKLGRRIDEDQAASDGSFTVPAKAKRSSTLTAFNKAFDSKNEAEKMAYVSGQFILSSIGKNTRSTEWLNSHGYSDIVAAMSEGTNSAGGFVVPDPLEATIITIAEENGVCRRYARPSTMTSDTLSVALRTAGLTVYYPGENTAITASQLTLSRALLTAKKYATLTQISSELSEDSVVSIANEVAMNIGLAFALAEDTNAFLGDGTSTYASVTGLASALDANSINDAASGNVSWATLDLADFEATAAKLKRFGGQNPCWFINSAGYFNAMVRLMNASGGTPGSEVASGYDARFLGYPVCFTQVLPSAPSTSTIAAYFGDLSQAVYMGNRKGITIASDMGGTYFAADQIAIRGIERVAITVENQDTSAAGPVVALKTAAS